MIEITGMHETLLIGILVIIILLFLSAFFSGSETANGGF
jgi:Mg2+/Co2+ transporter CorB